MSYSGVTPVNQIEFSVLDGSNEYTVKDAEALDISFDNGIEEWNPMDQNGWVNRLMTAKSMTISLSGKRNFGDAGNDYVASLAFKIGLQAQKILKITFPDGAVLSVPGVINVTSMGGESTAVSALEWEVQSTGEPTYTPSNSVSSNNKGGTA